MCGHAMQRMDTLGCASGLVHLCRPRLLAQQCCEYSVSEHADQSAAAHVDVVKHMHVRCCAPLHLNSSMERSPTGTHSNRLMVLDDPKQYTMSHFTAVKQCKVDPVTVATISEHVADSELDSEICNDLLSKLETEARSKERQLHSRCQWLCPLPQQCAHELASCMVVRPCDVTGSPSEQ